ncbi:MAG TPA: DUF3883 domain-containing protein [Deltaproteobacteria bacterium]|nr:DUF3883 domain-containing protein [Deltaproteobacteria bacterium]HPJ94073.1 DUF3883 domain-containing protein [Deltaproteobacteria bacterium]HPR50956.1 DUF3883 domain-containing protein [Deltaproteobacteria bacterium]
MIQLVLYQKYSRKEVHTIFAPTMPFSPGRGAWGVYPIVSLHDRPGDYLFFSTHEGKPGSSGEGITQEGVYTWRSMARQTLKDPQIQRFIRHDELKNSIYLFYRQKPQGRYTYLGRLKYLRHDKTREKPVYIQWQIIDWNISYREVTRLGLVLQGAPKGMNNEHLPLKSMLEESLPDLIHGRVGIPTLDFQKNKSADHSDEEAGDSALNLAGEMIVIAREKRLLIEAGRADLAHKVRHVAALEGDYAGYDIFSYAHDARVKYIEVKTTRGPAQTPFYLRPHELEFARKHPGDFYLYRVYEYDEALNAGKLYITSGDIEKLFQLTPTMYRVVPGDLP